MSLPLRLLGLAALAAATEPEKMTSSNLLKSSLSAMSGIGKGQRSTVPKEPLKIHEEHGASR